MAQAWQRWHQLDRRVRLDPGDASLVGKGRRPAAAMVETGTLHSLSRRQGVYQCPGGTVDCAPSFGRVAATMDHDQFWTLVEATRLGGGDDCEQHTERLTAALRTLPPSEIRAFDTIRWQLLAERCPVQLIWDDARAVER